MDLASESKMNSEGGEGRPGESEYSPPLRRSVTHKLSFKRSEGDDSYKCDTLFSVAPPTSLPLQGGPTQRKKLSAPRISLSLDQSEDDLGETPDDLDINVDDLDTSDEGDYLDYTDHEMDWEGGCGRRHWQFGVIKLMLRTQNLWCLCTGTLTGFLLWALILLCTACSEKATVLCCQEKHCKSWFY